MGRAKIPRKSTNIDMTAMCDVAFLLLSFFILATKTKPPACRGVSHIGHQPAAGPALQRRQSSGRARRITLALGLALQRSQLSARASAFALALLCAGCIQYVSPPTEPNAAQRLADVERLFADARSLYFQVYVTEANGSGRSARGVSLAELRASYAALRERAGERLSALDAVRYGDEDRRALAAMRTALSPDGATTSDSGGGTEADCRYDVAAIAGEGQADGAAGLFAEAFLHSWPLNCSRAGMPNLRSKGLLSTNHPAGGPPGFRWL